MKVNSMMSVSNSQKVETTLFALFASFVVSLPTFALEFAGGTGEHADPYQIATAEQLIGLGEDPNLYDKHFVLVADIALDPNLPGGRVFKGAVISDANGAYPFNGQFDGNHHTISNLVIRGGDTYGGLFGITGETALIQNLSLMNVSVHGITTPPGRGRSHPDERGQVVFSYTGGLVGSNRGTIRNCSMSGYISDCPTVGGLTGFNSGSVNSCHSQVSVEANTAGGLVGKNIGTISESSSDSEINGREYTGGLLGYNDGGILISCHFSGMINTHSHNCNVGGLVGYSYSGCIRSCFNRGKIYTRSDHRSIVGGLVGYSVDDCIHSCFNRATIETYSVAYTGGLVGCSKESVIQSCYNTGPVDLKYGGIAGGLVGSNSGVIQSSYHIGMISDHATAHSSNIVGGLVGGNTGIIKGCYSIGIVQAEEVRYSGGLVAVNSGHISQCYSVGLVNGRLITGGLVGANEGDGLVSECFSTTRVAVQYGEAYSGLVGFGFPDDGNGIVLSSFWDADISGHEISNGGTALSSEQMRDIQIFLDAGWDFIDEWDNGRADGLAAPWLELSYPC